jgi:hypothetical protein
MAGKWEFFLYGEDTNANPRLFFGCGIARKDEGSFGQVHLASDDLQLGITEASRVSEDGEGVSLKRLGGEYIPLHEGEAILWHGIPLRPGLTEIGGAAYSYQVMRERSVPAQFCWVCTPACG